MPKARHDEFEALLARSSLGARDVVRAERKVSKAKAALIIRRADGLGGVSRKRHIERYVGKNGAVATRSKRG